MEGGRKMIDVAQSVAVGASPGARVSPPAASRDGDGVLDLRSRLDYSTLLRVGTPAFRGPDRGRPRPQQATTATGYSIFAAVWTIPHCCGWGHPRSGDGSSRSQLAHEERS